MATSYQEPNELYGTIFSNVFKHYTIINSCLLAVATVNHVADNDFGSQVAGYFLDCVPLIQKALLRCFKNI